MATKITWLTGKAMVIKLNRKKTIVREVKSFTKKKGLLGRTLRLESFQEGSCLRVFCLTHQVLRRSSQIGYTLCADWLL